MTLINHAKFPFIEIKIRFCNVNLKASEKQRLIQINELFIEM